MNKWTKILFVCGLGLIVAAILLAVIWMRQPAKVEPTPFVIQTVGGQNLGFEGEYVAWQGAEERKIAPGWQLWYKTDWEDEKDTLSPPRAESTSSIRRQGEKAQHLYWKDWKNFDACVYQQVGGLIAGDYIRFSVWAKVDTDMGVHDMQTRIGLDPSGGTDPLSIQYETHPENWDSYTMGNGEWEQLSVTMRADSAAATLYACAHPRWPMRFSVYWDDAAFSSMPEKLTYLPLTARRYWNPPEGVLYNPDLELNWGMKEGYQLPIEGYTNVFVAPYWMPFWNDNHNPDTGENRQPEYNYTDRAYRVHSGAVAQQYGLSAWGNFEAGIYQVITGTHVSDTLRFGIWGMGWSSTDASNDRYSDTREGLNLRVGIDPYGGESYTSTQIVWSDYYDPYDEWHPFVITATAQSDRVSVWAYAHPSAYWIRFNQVFWDNAYFVVEPPR